MTLYSEVYDAFLSKILEDEWGEWTREEVEVDLEKFLNAALSRFKFPKELLNPDSTEKRFGRELEVIEIEILATFMKVEWLNRSIMTWENIKPLYEERDFSQSNFLDKLIKTLEFERTNARQLESIYYRVVENRPFNYHKMAGMD